MYEIDSHDHVVALAEVPPPDPGDSLPLVLAKDNLVVLSYVAGRDLTILATFPYCCAQLFGKPDFRSLRKHPLTARGLKPHGAFEVLESSWVRALEARDGPGKRKHFIFTFRDSAFECVAAGIGVELIREDDDTVKLMARRLYM